MNEAMAVPPARPPRRAVQRSGSLWHLSWSRARTEQAAPDAQHRRAGEQRLLEVVAHAHRRLAEPELLDEGGDTAEHLARAGAATGRGHGHQPGDVEIEAAQPGHQLPRLRPGNAGS